MSELHSLVVLTKRPITFENYIPELNRLLKSGISATYTLEQAAAYKRGSEDIHSEDYGSDTTPLHILARSLPPAEELSDSAIDVVHEIMNILFQYGASWNFLDYENKHIGDLLLERGYNNGNKLYSRLVDAGVSAELLLRKVNATPVEFLSGDMFDTEDLSAEIQVVKDPFATATDKNPYLKTPLEYTGNALITKDNQDGVMMDWESDLMKMAAHSLAKNAQPGQDFLVLNIGFGMGIIDSYIQEHNPTRHYICEAHPDVLTKMKKEGWYDKANVIILEGCWQDSLKTLLDRGDVFFDGIYYDTFGEHYNDMLDLYDLVVGLLKPHGIFSFFNGLGADRPICYDVYRRIVEIDVATYGMTCTYKDVSLTTLPNWDNIKRPYYNCSYYYHPEITFN